MSLYCFGNAPIFFWRAWDAFCAFAASATPAQPRLACVSPRRDLGAAAFFVVFFFTAFFLAAFFLAGFDRRPPRRFAVAVAVRLRRFGVARRFAVVLRRFAVATLLLPFLFGRCLTPLKLAPPRLSFCVNGTSRTAAWAAEFSLSPRPRAARYAASRLPARRCCPTGGPLLRIFLTNAARWGAAFAIIPRARDSCSCLLRLAAALRAE